MALTKFGFIVVGDDFVQHQGTERFSMKVVGVKNASQGPAVAQEMVAEGIQLGTSKNHRFHPVPGGVCSQFSSLPIF